VLFLCRRRRRRGNRVNWWWACDDTTNHCRTKPADCMASLYQQLTDPTTPMVFSIIHWADDAGTRKAVWSKELLDWLAFTAELERDVELCHDLTQARGLTDLVTWPDPVIVKHKVPWLGFTRLNSRFETLTHDLTRPRSCCDLKRDWPGNLTRPSYWVQ